MYNNFHKHIKYLQSSHFTTLNRIDIRHQKHGNDLANTSPLYYDNIERFKEIAIGCM